MGGFYPKLDPSFKDRFEKLEKLRECRTMVSGLTWESWCGATFTPLRMRLRHQGIRKMPEQPAPGRGNPPEKDHPEGARLTGCAAYNAVNNSNATSSPLP